MRIRLEVNEALVKIYVEIPTQDVKKYHKWLMGGVIASIPFLVSTAIKILPPVPEPFPLSNNHEVVKPR